MSNTNGNNSYNYNSSTEVSETILLQLSNDYDDGAEITISHIQVKQPEQQQQQQQ